MPGILIVTVGCFFRNKKHEGNFRNKIHRCLNGLRKIKIQYMFTDPPCGLIYVHVYLHLSMIRFSYLLFITIHALKLGCDFKILILWYHHTFPAFLILNARNIGIVLYLKSLKAPWLGVNIMLVPVFWTEISQGSVLSAPVPESV